MLADLNIEIRKIDAAIEIYLQLDQMLNVSEARSNALAQTYLFDKLFKSLKSKTQHMVRYIFSTFILLNCFQI